MTAFNCRRFQCFFASLSSANRRRSEENMVCSGEWRLISQMPHGLNGEKIEDREFIKFEDMVKIDQ